MGSVNARELNAGETLHDVEALKNQMLGKFISDLANSKDPRLSIPVTMARGLIEAANSQTKAGK